MSAVYNALKKAKARAWPNPFEILAKIERLQPGKLASWERAQRPMPKTPHNAFFVNVTRTPLQMRQILRDLGKRTRSE